MNVYTPQNVEMTEILTGKVWYQGIVTAGSEELWYCAHCHKYPDTAYACAVAEAAKLTADATETEREDDTEDCPDCGGSGSVLADVDYPEPGHRVESHDECETCTGSGKVEE